MFGNCPILKPLTAMQIAGGVFSPTDIAGLKFWFKDAGVFNDAGSTPAADADLVYQWNDQSGNGNHLTQPTSTKRPTYKTAIRNGLPIVRFDSANTTSLLFSLLSITSGSRTMFVAANIIGGSAAFRLLFDSQSGRFVIGFGDSGGWKVAWYDSAAVWRYPGSMTTGWQRLAWILPDGGTGNVYRDGTSIGTGTYTGTAIGGTTVIGARYDQTDRWLTADIGEILLYDSALSSPDHARVESYLSRWS